MTSDIRILASDLLFPEGPVAMADGSVIVVEIVGGRIARIAADGSKQVLATPGGGPNGQAIGPDGHLYVCNNGGLSWSRVGDEIRLGPQPPDYSGGRIERVNLATGAIECVFNRSSAGRPLSGPNDIVFDRTGGFWFTDIGKVRHRDMDRGGVYYAPPGHATLQEAIFPLERPNGIALSPDETTLYVAETVTGRLWAFDLDAPGSVSRHPWPSPNGGRLLIGLPGYQQFDSMAVDGAGNVCVATLFNGGITIVSPSGEFLSHVAMPDFMTTNICFGGPDMRTAFVTLSSTGRLASVNWPSPGHRLNFQQ